MSMTPAYFFILICAIVFGPWNQFLFRISAIFLMVYIVLRLDEIISLMKGAA